MTNINFFASLVSRILFVDINSIHSGSSHALSNNYIPVLTFHWFSLIMTLITFTTSVPTAKLFGDHFKYVVGNSALFFRILISCFATCSTLIATIFFIMAKYHTSVILSFFILLKPVLGSATFDESDAPNGDLVKLCKKGDRLLMLNKLSVRLVVVVTIIWELIALYNMYIDKELYIYDVFWSVKFVLLSYSIVSTWNLFLLLFIIGCDLFTLKCRMLREFIAQAQCDTANIVFAFNKLIRDVKKFDNVTKYFLAIFDICLLPTLGILINQAFSNRFHIALKLIICIGLMTVVSALLALYVTATITNSNINQTQLIFAQKIVIILRHLSQMRITHTESYKISYLICRIFKNNLLGMTLGNLTVMTKMKLFKTVIQVSRYCMLGYKMKRLFDN